MGSPELIDTSGTASEATSGNQAVVSGQLVDVPTVRQLPSGGNVVTFAVTVRSSDAATTSVPVAWFDAPQRVHRWNKGASVVVAGAVVRRFYRAGGVTGSRTEIVAHAGYLWSAKKSVARELRRSAVAILELASADTQS